MSDNHIRWDFLEKGGELFMDAKPAPADFYILYVGNECHAAFCRTNPDGSGDWLVLFNGLFHPGTLPGMLRNDILPGTLTLVEAKDEVVKRCNAR